MPKFKVIWYERYVCEGEAEADTEEEAISQANAGEVEDNDPTFLERLEEQTRAELIS